MTYQLKAAMETSIITLSEQGWSNRRIARELGINRKTVDRHVRLARQADVGLEEPSAAAAVEHCHGTGQNGPNLPPGPERPGGEGMATPAPGDQRQGLQNGPNLPPGATAWPNVPPGPPSLCSAFGATVAEMLGSGLTARRIYQDLRASHGYGGGYDSVKRFVRKLLERNPLPFRRMEAEPGQEAQVDFGRGAAVLLPDGKRKMTWLFRIVLSHSRKAYSEVVLRQTTEDFIRAIENAFRSFGGATRTLVVDNLRAAVSRADWFDPDLNPKVAEFCAHYSTAMLPAKPYMPRHKGKIERAVGYAKCNALKGREFNSVREQNEFLLDWERNVADTRVHGTTREQVSKAFERERPALTPLPATLFPCFREGRRSVHRDGHVEVAKAYYSVPPEHVQREVWVRWDGRVVRIFNMRMEQVALHAQAAPGKFSTDGRHLPKEKVSSVERGLDWLLQRSREIGPGAAGWAEAMARARGVRALRVLQGLLGLSHKLGAGRLDAACGKALGFGMFRLRELRSLADATVEQPPLDFLEAHPLIRDMAVYGRIVVGNSGQGGDADNKQPTGGEA